MGTRMRPTIGVLLLLRVLSEGPATRVELLDSLQDELGVGNERTLRRYLSALRESGFEISRSRGRYELRGSPTRLAFTKHEALATLNVVESLAERDPVYGEHLASASIKLREALPKEAVRFADSGRVEFDLSFANDLPGNVGVLDTLRLATHRNQRVEIQYHSLASGGWRKRTVEPLRIFYAQRAHRLSAHEQGKSGLTEFRVNRIKEVKMLPDKFSPQAHIRRFEPVEVRLSEKAFVAYGKSLIPDDSASAVPLRTAARNEALNTLIQNPENRLWTLPLPTGLGKTLAAAALATTLRELLPAPRRRIFIVLPFLSIIDQTAQVYSELLGGETGPPTSTLMQSHSLSERTYDDTEERDAEFFLDTWDSEIVVTTFDQFLFSLLGNRARHQMRFHNLADSILIFDEIQAMPTQLWDIVNYALTQLTEHLNSTAILMTATQPRFVTGAKNLIARPERYYGEFGRYRLVLRHKTPTKLEEFIQDVIARREELEKERVLITLNTRSSARAVRDALAGEWNTPVYFLTADVTPKDRLVTIDRIKASSGKDSRPPCLVVSTQVIEAGVDVDMSLVMRDFAPLDSLVQIAGRCNRNRLWPRKDVEIYHLRNENGNSLAEMVYTVGIGSPDVRLQDTRTILEPFELVYEEDVLGICDGYFSRLRDGKDLGFRHTRRWATLDEEQPDIRTLLKGERGQQVQLIVAERDDGDLRGEIDEALEIEDRWDRRRALRKLAGRIARVTVPAWVKKAWHPGQIADPLGRYDASKEYWEHPWWVVRPGNYDPDTGLNLEGDHFV